MKSSFDDWSEPTFVQGSGSMVYTGFPINPNYGAEYFITVYSTQGTGRQLSYALALFQCGSHSPRLFGMTAAVFNLYDSFDGETTRALVLKKRPSPSTAVVESIFGCPEIVWYKIMPVRMLHLQETRALDGLFGRIAWKKQIRASLLFFADIRGFFFTHWCSQNTLPLQ